MKTIKSLITDSLKRKQKGERKKPKNSFTRTPDWTQASKDQILPSGASYSNTFVEEKEPMKTFKQHLVEHMEYTEPMSGREAIDKGHINKSMLRTIHKHVGNYLGDYHNKGEPQYRFHTNPIAVHHIHIDNKDTHIQFAVSKRGKHFHHAIFHKEPSADHPGGVKFSLIKKRGFDND